MQSQFRDSIAFQWDHSASRFEPVPYHQLGWSLSDAGTLYGAILVERFRSYGKKLADLSHHQTRLLAGATELGIDLSNIPMDLTSIAESLLAANRDRVELAGDASIVLLVSPGELSRNVSSNGFSSGQPTLMVHLSELPYAKLNRWYHDGADLFLDTHRVVPDECWPNQIKCRSRLPYFLAQNHPHCINTDALAILRTATGCIADTAVANLLIVDRRGELISPKKQDMLMGCTLQALEQILSRHNIAIHYQDVTASMLYDASEIILTGSSGGIWFARSYDGHPLRMPAGLPTTRHLTELWKQHVGFDFVAQAAMRSAPA